jgi:hypothetical protein
MMLMFLTVGVGFVVLFAGLFLAFEILALTHAPAYRLFRRMLQSQSPPAQFVAPPFWTRISYYVFLPIPALFILTGAKILAAVEYCSYSFLCLFVRFAPRWLGW